MGATVKATYVVLMYPGLMVLTLILLGPSSHAMLRAICSTADFDVLYDTQGWPCDTTSDTNNIRGGRVFNTPGSHRSR